MESDDYIGEVSAEDQAAWEIGHAWQRAEAATARNGKALDALRRTPNGWAAVASPGDCLIYTGATPVAALNAMTTDFSAFCDLVTKLRER